MKKNNFKQKFIEFYIGEAMEVTDFEELGIRIYEGESADIYRRGDVTLKVFKKDFPRAAALREAEQGRVIYGAGIRTPKLLGTGERADGRFVIAREFIAGRTFLEMMIEQPEDYDEVLDGLVEAQIGIHSHKLSSGILAQNDLLTEQIRSLPYITGQRKEELIAELATKPKHNKLCHGNFGPDNAIVPDEEGDLYLIDWSQATLGNASADVAKTYLKLSCMSTETAENYIRLYSEKTGISKQTIRDWLPIMAASTLAAGTSSQIHRSIMLVWLS